MFRRTYLNVLAVLPGLSFTRPHGESRTTITPIEREGDLWFWYYVYSAATRDHVLSMERSRERAVNEMNLTVLIEEEAREVLRRAHAGEYTIDNMPDRWLRVLRSIDQIDFT